MFPRRTPRLVYPKNQFMIREDLLPVPKSPKAEGGEPPKRNPLQPPKKVPVKEGEGDPKLAGAILELVQGIIPVCIPLLTFPKGRGAVRIPKEFAALHLDFAKAQYDGHTGARFLFPLLTVVDSQEIRSTKLGPSQVL